MSKVSHPRYTWRVRFPGPDGKTVQRWFTTKTDASEFAKEREKEIGRGGLDFAVASLEERAAVSFWREFVKEQTDAPPPALLSILQEYAERWKATRSSVTVAAAVDSYEASKTAEGLRPISLQGIRTRCGRFAAVFGQRPICSITTAEISDWIMTLEATRQRGEVKGKGKDAPQQIGLLAKRNHRLAVSGLFSYAKARGWVKENPVTDATRPKPPKTRPEVLRPGCVARLFTALESAAPALVPFWAVRFFAGIREQEGLRLDWSMIDLANGEIHLPDTITKTGHSRTVKIEPALAAYLAPHKQPDGAIVTRSAMARRYHLAKALAVLSKEDEAAKEAAKAGGTQPARPFPVPMPANVARHSFATYHLMAFRHAGETALQLGHGGSPEMLHRHYKGVASESEALAFWAIRPASGAANVVSMKAAVADGDAAKLSTKKKKAK